MTSPKINTTFRGGSRFYIHPGSGDKVPGVTSILNMLPKPFLKAWAAKEVATEAVSALDGSGAGGVDWLTPMIVAQGSAAAIDFLKRSPDRNTRKAADQGTAAHGIFEALLLGKALGPLTEDMEVFARQFEDLLRVVEPTTLRTEDTVWSEAHGYAGSFDALLDVGGTRCWVDNKTTRSGVHAEVALQLAAYRKADYLLDGDTGEQLRQPEADHGLVFHVRPDGWAVYEVPIGDEVFAYFLSLRHIFNWDAQVSKQIVGRPAVKGDALAAGSVR